MSFLSDLTQVSVGQKVQVSELPEDVNLKLALVEAGILCGDELQITGRTLAGGPLSFKHGETSFFALRKKEASQMQVISL